jgi:CRISPR-associated protein Cas6
MSSETQARRRVDAERLTTPMTDIAFELAGSSVPRGAVWLLAQAIERRLPWFADDPRTGMHPLRALPTSYGSLLLARRAKLVLRIPVERLDDARHLEGAAIDAGGTTLRLGASQPRALRASGTLAAQRVASVADSVGAFEAEAMEQLRGLDVSCALIAGLRREEQVGGTAITGYALTLHGLSPAASLRVQAAGLGGQRRLGWGVFVPAKAIQDLTPAAD